MSKQLSIIGFGNQAKAWALNLRDSGYKVFIGLRDRSPSFEKARLLKFETFTIGETLPSEDVALLSPDDTHKDIVETFGGQQINLIFAHGFSLLYRDIAQKHPSLNCLLLAPKAIASEVRLQYETGGKLGALFSVEKSGRKEESLVKIRTLARDLGITSLHPTSIEAETKADLFSEQTLLCSTLPYSALYSFNKLIEEGVNEETAYFECWYEVKLIADTMVRLGPAKFFELISPNALAGSEIGRKTLFKKDYFEKLNRIFEEIDNKNFAESLDHTNFERLKTNVSSFWNEQRLTRVHEKLSKELF